MGRFIRAVGSVRAFVRGVFVRLRCSVSCCAILAGAARACCRGADCAARQPEDPSVPGLASPEPSRACVAWLAELSCTFISASGAATAESLVDIWDTGQGQRARTQMLFHEAGRLDLKDQLDSLGTGGKEKK